MNQQIPINTTTPNPFSIRPIDTQWSTNELIMNDPKLRVTARIAPLDIAQQQSTYFVSPQHLNPGWKWCGGPNCKTNPK